MNAARLDAFIERIRRDYSMPKLKVDIVAHSMGALLARYFIRYGKKDVLDGNTFQPDNAGAGKVRKVILIGAPNMGSVSGLQNFLTGYRLGLGSIPTETIATMPGSYELLPHANLPGNTSFQDNLLNILLLQETTEDRMLNGG